MTVGEILLSCALGVVGWALIGLVFWWVLL